MAKRFVDTEIWGDKWYRKLPCKYKELWRYICENCDNAGVWKVDIDLAIFQIGETLEHDEALRFLNDGKERVSVLNHGTYWQVKEYVKFQFGALSDKSRVHESVLKLIENHRVSKGYQYPIHRVKDKDKDKDKDIYIRDMGVGEEMQLYKHPTIEQIREYFNQMCHPEEAEPFFDHYEANGWKVGGIADVHSWTALCRKWIRNTKKKPSSQERINLKAEEIAKEIAHL
jgi:hypothetical protein